MSKASSILSYTFRTSTWDDGDTYIELYNSNWQLLASNDDMEDDLNSAITYTLQSGNIYYIKIYNNYSLSDDIGFLYYE